MLETHEECLACLEQIRWNGVPTCPYCESTKATTYKKEHRYRCNSCFTSYSVTVGTLFHRTRVGLHKWFRAILILHKLNPDISARKLARELEIHRATATGIIKKLQDVDEEQGKILSAIVKAFESSK